MAQGRLIHASMPNDRNLSRMSFEAYATYVNALPHLDRDGLITGDPLELWAKTALRRADLIDRMPELINQWIQHGSVIRYTIGSGETVLFFKRFREWNPNLLYHREAASRFPPPPEWRRQKGGLVPECTDLARAYAESIPGANTYKRILLQAANIEVEETTHEFTENFTRQGNGKVMHDARLSRAEDQHEDQHDDHDDQIRSLPIPVLGMGGVQGGDEITPAGALLPMPTPTEFPHAALDTPRGNPLAPSGFLEGSRHPGSEQVCPVDAPHDTLQSFDITTLALAAYNMGALFNLHTEWDGFEKYITTASKATLIALLRWLKRYHDAPHLLDNARNFVAILRTNLRVHEAYLNGAQLTELITFIMQFVGETDHAPPTVTY